MARMSSIYQMLDITFSQIWVIYHQEGRQSTDDMAVCSEAVPLCPNGLCGNRRIPLKPCYTLHEDDAPPANVKVAEFAIYMYIYIYVCQVAIRSQRPSGIQSEKSHEVM